ncbi:hypothetical protein CDL15_Pgr026323 [Punica granatum]|uniref:Uncharacterized protein n=1 Tax=Punica granatum TaxID=22663 RepID=A0A218XWF8_PUNGR|nr:hypothetical protein CDL15_Pgr026323 [Punica granatum]
MEKEQLQIKHFIGEKSEEFKNVFLEQMPPEQSPIKSVAIDSRMNPFEERRNDMIHLEDPLQGHEEESQDNRVGHEGELLDKHVPARASKRARAKRIQQAMQRLLLHVYGGEVELLGGLHVEQETTTVHILEIYLKEITVLVTRVYDRMTETHQWIRRGFADEPAPEQVKTQVETHKSFLDVHATSDRAFREFGNASFENGINVI